MRTFTTLTILALLAACTPKNGARSVYSRWRTSWADRDGAGIHRGLSERWRTISDPERWRQASADKTRKTVPIPSKDVKVEWIASIDSELGPLTMKKTPKGWRFVGAPFPRYSRGTPKEAVTAFIFALKFQRLDILSSLLTEEFRISLSKPELKALFDLKKREIRELLKNLENAKGNPILVQGKNAVFPYSDTKSLKLVQEEDGWCIVDPD